MVVTKYVSEPQCSLPMVGKHIYRPLVKGDAGTGDTNGHFPVSLHLAGAPAIGIDQSGLSRGKLFCPDAKCLP